MLRRVLLSLGLIVLLPGTGAAVAWLLIRTRPEPARVPRHEITLLVDGLTVQPRTVVEPIVGYATARADRAANVAAEVAGRVQQVSDDLHVGRQVRAGQVLVRIDDREYRHRLDQARSDLAAAEAELARLEKEERNLQRLLEIAASERDIAERDYRRVLALFESGQAPQRELDLARQALDSARRNWQVLDNEVSLLPARKAAQRAARDRAAAEVALAELQVQRCEVRAPFDGRIAEVRIEQGERVAPGTLLFAILDPRHIELPVQLPVSLRDRVRVGARCRLHLDSNPGLSWEGQVVRIAPQADESTRTFDLFVEVDNSQQALPLLPGMFVRAVIEGPTLRNVLLVPRNSIQHETVLVSQNGVVRRVPVRVERHVYDQSVVSGLQPGQTVLVSNLDLLHEGMHVRVRPVAPVTAGPVLLPADQPGPASRPAQPPAPKPPSGT